MGVSRVDEAIDRLAAARYEAGRWFQVRRDDERRRKEHLRLNPPPPDPEFAALDADLRAREWKTKQARLDEDARDWYESSAAERDKIKRGIRRYLRSPEGRDGATDDDVQAHLQEKYPDSDCTYRGLVLVIESLIRARAIRVIPETEDDVRRLYNPREFDRLRPERRFAVKDIGTVPQAVLCRPGLTGGRLKVAVALSGHFYRNRRSHPKARAIGRRELAKSAGVTPNKADEAVRWLTDEGLLEVARRAIGSRGREYRWTRATKTYKAPRKRR